MMAGQTDHYQLQKLDRGDPFSTGGQKYTTVDRDMIDRLLFLGAENHQHTGVAAASMDPTTGPALTLVTTGGALPTGTRIYYKYTWVDPQGFETAASPETYVDTPLPIATPLAPALSAAATGGTLVQGGYFYAISAYSGISSVETLAVSSYVLVPAGGTGKVDLMYPVLPTGATGWNIYRRAPAASDYVFLANVVVGATPPTDFFDDGSITPDPNRHLPAVNTTSSTNSVTVVVPTVPVGYTWNLYRTYSNVWDNSLLHNVVETTVEGGTIITPTYPDVGAAVYPGAPPAVSELIGTPAKIDLATMATGSLPPAAVVHPMVVSFSFPGVLTVQTGRSVWVNEFSSAKVVSARAALGRGATPASTPVQADVIKGTGTTTGSTIFGGTTPTYPSVAVGAQIGAAVAPPATVTLAAGDWLAVDIHQTGGGATPTDHDLTVNVLLVVSGSGLPTLP